MSAKKPHRANFRFKLAATLIITVAFFILLEYTVRKLYEPAKNIYSGMDPEMARLSSRILEEEPDLLWKLQPDIEVVHRATGRIMSVNSFGYRGPDFSMDKPPDTVRVVFLGDSFLFGMAQNDHETIPYLVERLWKKGGAAEKVEVNNLAVPGYSSFQGRVQAERLFPLLKPDIVVIGFGLSDSALVNYTDAEVRASIPKPGKLFTRLNRFLGWSRVFQLIHSFFHPKETKNTFGRTRFKEEEGTRIIARVPPQEFRKNIAAIIQAARKEGGRPVLLDSNLANYYSLCALKKISSEKNVPFLSAREILEKEAPPGCFELKDPNRRKRLFAIQVTGIPGEVDDASGKPFLILVPSGTVRHPRLPEKIQLRDDGSNLDLTAGDGIYTARLFDGEYRNFEFAATKRILLEQEGAYGLFINSAIFYRLPPEEELDVTGLYYSPVMDFEAPSFHEYLLKYNTTLVNEKGARKLADALLPMVKKPH